jgi:1,4-dihydroxy-2-naphthoate octaprenyltransferase
MGEGGKVVDRASESLQPEAPPGAAATWWLATRPFSFPASSMSVIFGAVLAVTVGGASMNWPWFVLSVLGMVCLHAAANLLNDATDFEKGLDAVVNPVSGAVVRGLLTPRQARLGALVLMLVGGLAGGVLVWAVGWPIAAIGGAGVVIGVLYSGKPTGLKYLGLGDVAVFLDFGILGALGAWTVQTGSLSWIPVIWAIPLSILVVAILHANNWRDIAGDREKRCVTVANLLGDRGSAVYYAFLLLSPFLIVVAMVALPWLTEVSPAMPWTFLVTLLALPLAARLLLKSRQRANPRNPLDFLALDGATAQLNLAFGVLCTLALLLHAWTGGAS